MYSFSIQKLIEIFAKFPTIGSRTATRFVFYLARQNDEEIDNLLLAIKNLKKNIKICPFCFNVFESGNTLCDICSNKNRDLEKICIVEKESDLLSIEKTKKYKGLYFLLGGTLPSLLNDNNKKKRIEEIKERIKNPKKFIESSLNIKEVIIALNATTEGDTTSLYLERFLSPLNIKITRLGRGLPIGGELEYADGETLINAIEGRK